MIAVKFDHIQRKCWNPFSDWDFWFELCPLAQFPPRRGGYIMTRSDGQQGSSRAILKNPNHRWSWKKTCILFESRVSKCHCLWSFLAVACKWQRISKRHFKAHTDAWYRACAEDRLLGFSQQRWCFRPHFLGCQSFSSANICTSVESGEKVILGAR